MLFLVPIALLAACQRTEDAPEAPMPEPVEVPPPPGAAPVQGEPAFVGVWSADPAWCLNPNGANRPVQLTRTRFTGYENSCEITQVTPTDVGWTATFTCVAEGQITTEPVSMEADAETLEINWINQGGQSVEWRRCPV